MKNIKLFCAAALIGASLLGTTAQARTLYWTGHAAVDSFLTHNPKWECFVQAHQIAEEGVRNSCMFDYHINYDTCMSAPIVRTEDLGSRYQGDWLTCTTRVFIQVP